jgi:DNA mismatch endonuclease, patch repair protein
MKVTRRKTRKAASRSEVMARVRSKDTAPELLVRRALWQAGFRYRLHRRDLPGSPDLVLSKRRIAIFVHGCFWHQHDGCRRSRRPASRADYWGPKLDRNVARDAAAKLALEADGWNVMVVWECEKEAGVERLLCWIEKSRASDARAKTMRRASPPAG